MTVLDDRPLVKWNAGSSRSPLPVRGHGHAGPCRAVDRPRSLRPDVAPLRYAGTGVSRSHAVHTRRPVGTAVTVAVAAAAALITLWLGSLAHFSGERAAVPAASPDRLAVVRVQAGETLQHLAGRVAPDAPVAQIVDRIRQLNELDSAAIEAGQTLIAPLG